MAKRLSQQNDTLRENLARVMLSSKILKSQSALAEASGVGQSTIGRILRGVVNPQVETVAELARALGTTTGELLRGSAHRHSETDEKATKPRPYAESGRIPLISWDEIWAFSENMNPSAPGKEQPRLDCPRKCGLRTFALEVELESMEPRYDTGDIIFVNPDMVARPGNDVIVRLEDRNEIAFRRLIERGMRRYLKFLNPNWPQQFIPLSAGAEIVGVVIGRWSDR